MSYDVNEYEFGSVLKLSGSERYEYFIQKIADWEELWSIRDSEGWGLMRDDSGKELVPIWPAEKYASACCTGVWEGYSPNNIPLDYWLEKWIPGMLKDDRLCAVFPLPTDKGVVVGPERLEKDISEALSQYESSFYGSHAGAWEPYENQE